MKKKILLICANYYPKISNNLKKGALNILKNESVDIIDVPGVFEIPLIISRYINKYNGIVALGCVIKGKTNHFELITNSVTNSIMMLSIKYKKPISNGIVSCFNLSQANNRSKLYSGKNKGKEAALAVLKILKIFNTKK